MLMRDKSREKCFSSRKAMEWSVHKQEALPPNKGAGVWAIHRHRGPDPAQLQAPGKGIRLCGEDPCKASGAGVGGPETLGSS